MFPKVLVPHLAAVWADFAYPAKISFTAGGRLLI